MLRGAVDGLSVVAPYGDAHYAASRPQLALKAPGTADDALLKLDNLFGLHPRWRRCRHFEGGQLAFVHASGSPDPTAPTSTRRTTSSPARRAVSPRPMAG